MLSNTLDVIGTLSLIAGIIWIFGSKSRWGTVGYAVVSLVAVAILGTLVESFGILPLGHQTIMKLIAQVGMITFGVVAIIHSRSTKNSN